MSDSDFRVGPGVPMPTYPMPSDPHFAPPTVKPKRKRIGLLITLAAVGVLAVAGFGALLVWTLLEKTPAGGVVAQAMEPPLVSAQKQCANGSRFVSVGDGGKTLTLNTEGKEQDGISYTMLECFKRELKMTDAVWSEVVATRALDGRQAGEWGDYHASWSYHPDSGLSMVVTVR